MKFCVALKSGEKRYRGFKWLIKNYNSIELNEGTVKALIGGVSLGLDERVMKLNIVAINLLEILIENASIFITPDM